VSADVLHAAVAEVPDGWLVDEPGFDTADDLRSAYLDWFSARLEASGWVAELVRVQGEVPRA
jgi:hypothetical protein